MASGPKSSLRQRLFGDSLPAAAGPGSRARRGPRPGLCGLRYGVASGGLKKWSEYFCKRKTALSLIFALSRRGSKGGTLPGKILNMFVIEGFCMGVVGAVIGDIVGIALVYVLNMFKISFDFGQQKGLLLQASIQPADVLMISIIVITVSVIASLQPAFKASRMEPIQALRHV